MTVDDLVWIDETGYNYEDYPAFLDFFKTSYQDIYGDDVYLGPDSQDGQWIAIQAQAAYDAAELGSATYNSFSPATAQGVGLSRVVKINGLERLIPTNSVVTLSIGGTKGTVLTNAIAIDELQQQWLIPTTTIPDAGTIDVVATAAAKGAVMALEDTVTGIFTPTQGWQSVNNAASATAGDPVEGDAPLRARQSVSTAIGSQTVFEATIAAVENVPGVLSVQGYENDTGTTGTGGTNSKPPGSPGHSVTLVVDGGADLAVAQAIQVKKTPGAQTYGTTSVALTDSKGMPLVINFYRPTNATIGAEVTLVELAGWDDSTKPLIAAALANAMKAVKIGGDEVITLLYMPAYLVGTPVFGTFTIASIELNKNGGSFFSDDIQLQFNEKPVCDPTTDIIFL